jgi:hypothetical protein
MISVYASFIDAFAGNLCLTIAARDESYALAQGTAVQMQVTVKTRAQAWTDTGLHSLTYYLTVNASNLAQMALMWPLDMGPFDVRLRARLGSPVGPWSEYNYEAYTPEMEGVAVELNARTVTYKFVRDGVAKRRGFGAGNPLTEDAAAELAEYITSANRALLEDSPWPEVKRAESVTCSNGFVTWAAIHGADYFEFWTADPNLAGSCATPLTVRDQNQLGLYLDTTLTNVFAKFTPRAPVFDSRPVVSGTTYPLGAVRYDDATGHCFEVIHSSGAAGSSLLDPTRWRPLPILWMLADGVKLLAIADALGNGEHERTQAADLRDQVEALLTKLSTRTMR